MTRSEAMTSPRRRAVVGARRGGEAVAGRPAFVWLARAGLLARGVSYGIIGILALELAVGSGGGATNQTGALKTIADQQFGKTLLIAMAAGLACYAVWRLVRAGIGHGTHEKDSAPERVAGVASGLAYATICLTAVKILTGASTSGGANSPKRTTGGVLDWTGGTEIVGAAGDPDWRCAPSGVQGPLKEIPGGLEDRGDERRGQARLYSDRCLRAPRADGRLRPRRLRPPQGRDGIRPTEGDRPRRSPSTSRHTTPTDRSCWGSSQPG